MENVKVYLSQACITRCLKGQHHYGIQKNQCEVQQLQRNQVQPV